MALTKKSLNNFLPNGFETQNKDGYKANFSNDRIISGFEKDTLEVLSGPNLNNFIDKTGKNFNTLNDLLEYFNAMPIDSFPIVNASNQLDYKSINSFFRNVGELVFSSVPIDDKNLHLADGTLLDGKGTYRVFVDFIGGLSSKYPSLFTDEATWQATVKKYGTCAKYVWDATNKTLRIPRLKGLIEATIDKDSIGNITEAGLPNITGTAQFSQEWESFGKYEYTGAFYLQQRKGNGVDGDRGNFDIVGFDASRSSSVYGKSNTVQPQTVKQYIYIVVSVDTEETQKLTSVFQYRGTVPTFADLPTEGNITGDVWNVEDTNVNYVWDGAEWDPLAGSVDLSGYYTKEECNTRFATVTSLESNVENLQSKITQNTTDIASLGLGGVVASSLEKGKALKYLETKGNIIEDADVYNDVYNYKHSSFDKDKFTLVGSPTITESGVASGFDKNNYLLGNINFDISNINDWEFLGDFTTNSDITTAQYPFSLYDVDGDYSIGICIQNSKYYFSISDNEGVLVNSASANPPIIANTKYFYKITYNSAEGYKCYLSQNTENLSLIASSTNTKKMNYGDTSIRIGRTGDFSPRPFLGSINLKQLSITVEGKEVFNGNKTGLDVIKEDNYTVIGNPVISDDGFISNITKDNYIKKPLNISIKNNFRVEGEFIYSSKDNIAKNDKSLFLLKIINAENIEKSVTCSTGWSGKDDLIWVTSQIVPQLIIRQKPKDGEKIKIILTCEKTQSTLELYYGERYYKTTVVGEMNCTKLTMASVGWDAADFCWTGLVNLNSFKIYVDDQLVYQPCLKIPYNISKTGLKVVNADARERVIGMGEDYGYSQYFTIDEENKNATLPIGAGITGRQDLIASFDDGTNKYEQFSDLTFKLSGTCKANTAVTFIQPYKDDTYKLSVPYSAKTKTGFTPTVTGDWFAEGKIYLD